MNYTVPRHTHSSSDVLNPSSRRQFIRFSHGYESKVLFLIYDFRRGLTFIVAKKLRRLASRQSKYLSTLGQIYSSNSNRSFCYPSAL